MVFLLKKGGLNWSQCGSRESKRRKDVCLANTLPPKPIESPLLKNLWEKADSTGYRAYACMKDNRSPVASKRNHPPTPQQSMDTY